MIDWPGIFRKITDSIDLSLLPSVSQIAVEESTPFHVLISTMISLRTKDDVTLQASRRLFEQAPTPEEMMLLPVENIEKLIYPAGFYKTKAKNIITVCTEITQKFGGKTPDSLDDLLAFPGVGRKTANLVLGLGFKKPAICVDTHVHRICNRIGWIETKNPDDTEFALADILPEKYWIEINELLVAFGQQVCTPQSPHCSKCTITNVCERIGVTRSR